MYRKQDLEYDLNKAIVAKDQKKIDEIQYNIDKLHEQVQTRYRLTLTYLSGIEQDYAL
jgi:hypothetical protein